ncbi:MAG TPA: gluconokinase [Nitrospiraceae bacterium]|nr:gluconokinase [Nitrospiraceae bacterium]
MIIILMGVSGSGKTAIGTRLAETLGWSFFDADDFHSASNIEKMRRGMPLTEQDRQPWLLTLRERVAQWLDEDLEVVLACSALKASYREQLLVDPSRVRLVYLKGSYALIQKRLIQRPRHFMPEELLASQFDTLEEPHGVFTVDIALRPREIVQRIRKELHV